VDAALEKRQVKRAYKIYAPAYDFVFDWIFHPGREQAIRLLGIKGGEQILEVGIGTGLNLPLYPADCRITGIDLSEEMLEKAQDKVVELGLNNVTLKAMDATVMDFSDSEFDFAHGGLRIFAIVGWRPLGEATGQKSRSATWNEFQEDAGQVFGGQCQHVATVLNYGIQGWLY